MLQYCIGLRIDVTWFQDNKGFQDNHNQTNKREKLFLDSNKFSNVFLISANDINLVYKHNCWIKSLNIA